MTRDPLYYGAGICASALFMFDVDPMYSLLAQLLIMAAWTDRDQDVSL